MIAGPRTGRRGFLKWSALATVSATGVIAASGCAPGSPPPPPAVMRETAPPWDAPRDAVANIDAADLLAEPLDTTTNQRILTIEVVVDGVTVPLVPYIGIDRRRALQAAAHTHDDSGEVWLEGTEAPQVTLGQFFTLWGVRFDSNCLGAACGELVVTADGEPVADPGSLVLAEAELIRVIATS